MELTRSYGQLSKKQAKTQELFLKWLLNHLSSLTRETYGQTLREFAGFLDERKIKISHPKEVKSLHIIAYRDWLILKEQAPKTVCRKLTCLSSVFDEMLFAQEIKTNTVQSVKRPKPDEVKAKTFLSDREIKKLLALFPDKEKLYQLQNKTLLSLLAFTGQRITSIVSLKKKQISMIGQTPVLQLKVKGGTQKLLPVPEEPARLLIFNGDRLKELGFLSQVSR